MGQVLFWIEAAITATLFVALGVVLLVRIKRTWARRILGTAWGIVALLPWVVVIGGFGAVEFLTGGAMFPLVCSSVAAGLFVVAAIVAILRGRRRPAADEPRQASRWRVDRLLLAIAAGVLITCMTYWNLDLAARQEMATMQVEVGTIALSVAPPQIPDSQNAALLYRQSWEILDAENEKWGNTVAEWLIPDKGKGEFDPNNVQMLAFLNKQAGVIDLLHKAGQLPGCNFGTDYSQPSFTTLMPNLVKPRNLSRLLCLSARVNAHQGNMAEAMKDLSTCFAMAQHVTAEPPLIACLVGCGWEELATETLQYVLSQGTPSAKDFSELKINGLFSFSPAFHRSMRMEKAFGLSFFVDPRPFPGEFRVPITGHIGPGAFSPYRVFLLKADMTAYMRCLQRYDVLSGKPYYESMKEWKEAANQIGRTKRRGGLFAAFLMPTFSKVAEMVAIADARHRLDVLAVAMCSYRDGHKAFPADLGSLVPKYTLSAPVDPFTGQGMKLARNSEGQVVIYSVGPDLEDNGGTPYDKQTRKGDVSLVLGK